MNTLKEALEAEYHRLNGEQFTVHDFHLVDAFVRVAEEYYAPKGELVEMMREETRMQPDDFRYNPDALAEACARVAQSFYAPRLEKMEGGWIATADRTPEPLPGKDYSPNVLAVFGKEVAVMAYCYIRGEEDASGWAWCMCYSIDGEPEFDDEYHPTHWQPIPAIPTASPSQTPTND